jgi:hypothetical protein
VNSGSHTSTSNSAISRDLFVIMRLDKLQPCSEIPFKLNVFEFDLPGMDE